MSAVDARARLRIDYERLVGAQSGDTYAGEFKFYEEPAELIFDDDRQLRKIELTIAIAEYDKDSTRPSLLGRDVLDQLRMDWNPGDDKIEFEFLLGPSWN